MPVSLNRPNLNLRDGLQDVQKAINGQPALRTVSGNKLPQTMKTGDFLPVLTASGISITIGGAKNTRRSINIPSDLSSSLKGYKAPQTGIVPPSITDNFPASGDFGWYSDTLAGLNYFVINDSGTLRPLSLSTLNGTFADITGTISAAQHGNLTSGGPLHNFSVISGTITSLQHGKRGLTDGTDPLHPYASHTSDGFMSKEHFDLLNTATTNPLSNTILLRDFEGGSSISFLNLATLGGGGPGSLLVNSIKVVGEQQPAISDPLGGTTVDLEARIALILLLTAMRTHGLIHT